ncbi:MAG: gfo/Idh/MocA family oxidoreductase, partial [Allomuricauda sp.]
MSSRRSFVKTTAMASAGISMMPNITFATERKNSNNKLGLGFIGVGLRGTNHLNNALQRKDVEIR